jgi:CSLREA domain-containing protein
VRVVALVALAGCGFYGQGSAPADAPADSPPADAPPVTQKVRFTTMTADAIELRPGMYGIRVTAVLRNELDVPITGVGATLTFTDGATDRAGDFRWRDLDQREGVAAPQPAGIAPQAEETYRFVVDVLPYAVPPGPIQINGAATFAASGSTLSASAGPPLPLPFAAMSATIVVDTATDETTNAGTTSLREALQAAQSGGAPYRIVFDPAVFPPSAKTAITLSPALGELPAIAVGVVVLDGSGAGVVIAADAAWEVPEGRYGLRVVGGTAIVHKLTFEDLAYGYRNENVGSDTNCGASNAQLEGGAIKVTGGTLIVDNSAFDDGDVAERNCYAASVRLHGGTGHRILRSTWTNQVMDSIYVGAAALEISGNMMNAGSTASRDDDCIYVDNQGGSDLWITGNLCVDMEYSAVVARGTTAGRLYVVHNTFVRNGRTDLSAVRREQLARQVTLRNNAYFADRPAAILADNLGTGFDIAYELVSGSTLCNATCPSATIDPATIATAADPMVMNAGGSTFADMTPRTGSPLINTGADWIDRNGSRPGRFSGAGPEVGAVELP